MHSFKSETAKMHFHSVNVIGTEMQRADKLMQVQQDEPVDPQMGGMDRCIMTISTIFFLIVFTLSRPDPPLLAA